MATVQLSRYQTGQTPRVRALEPAGCEERDLNNARASNSGIGHFWGGVYRDFGVDGSFKRGREE